MLHIQLKLLPITNKYTTAKVEQKKYIRNINKYNAEDTRYKWEHMSSYITYDRLIELQPIAMEQGYMFVY